MVRQYLKRKDLANLDVRFAFTPGQRVLIRSKRANKLAPRAQGPYVFVRYLGQGGLAAEIRDATGQSKILSTTHLRPMLSERPPRLYRYPPRAPKGAQSVATSRVTMPRAASFDSSLSSDVDTSDLESPRGEAVKRLRGE